MDFTEASQSPSGTGQPAGRGKRGRPSAAELSQIDIRLLDAAREVFVERGYAGATIDLIVERARASKRTVYDRLGDKPAIFEAVVSDLIRRRFQETEDLIRTSMEKSIPVREQLVSVAKAFHLSAIDRQSIALDRIVSAQASVFPALSVRLQRDGRDRAVSIVTSLLERAGATQATLGAEAFYALLVLQPLHLGNANSSDIDGACEAVVDFVLRGAGATLV